MSSQTRNFIRKFHNVFTETNINHFLKLSELYAYAHYLKNSIARSYA